MKTLFTVFYILIPLLSISQTDIPKFLDSIEVVKRFDEATLNNHNIKYPIFRVYEFADNLGKHELVLTENPKSIKDIDSIQAFCFLIEDGNKKLEWKITDFTIHPENTSEETSIWFWTKYLRLEDLNNDGLIDPIVVYGTKSKYGTEDGRLKILIFVGDKKHGIRHQNSGMDFGRNTRVDQSFYELNISTQNYVIRLMQIINSSGNTIFPAGWEENMKAKKQYFDEN